MVRRFHSRFASLMLVLFPPHSHARRVLLNGDVVLLIEPAEGFGGRWLYLGRPNLVTFITPVLALVPSSGPQAVAARMAGRYRFSVICDNLSCLFSFFFVVWLGPNCW